MHQHFETLMKPSEKSQPNPLNSSHLKKITPPWKKSDFFGKIRPPKVGQWVLNDYYHLEKIANKTNLASLKKPQRHYKNHKLKNRKARASVILKKINPWKKFKQSQPRSIPPPPPPHPQRKVLITLTKLNVPTPINMIYIVDTCTCTTCIYIIFIGDILQ